MTLTELAKLKAHWGISIQALIMRASHLGIMDEARKGSLFVQLSARGWRKAEPVEVHFEEPILLWTLLTRRYGQPPDLGAAEEDLGVQAMILRSLIPRPSQLAQ
jgi:Zn-dependent peptidase ImmA (M78 family)